jgi:hypothetical protein
MHRRSLHLYRGLTAAGLPWLSNALAAVTNDDIAGANMPAPNEAPEKAYARNSRAAPQGTRGDRHRTHRRPAAYRLNPEIPMLTMTSP